MEAFPYYSGDVLVSFLKRGGAVLTTGGVPFSMPVNDEGKLPVEGQPPDAFSLNIYERRVAPLGFKYYVHPYKPPVTEVNQWFLDALPKGLEVAGC